MVRNLFTPRSENGLRRYHWVISKADMQKVGRGPWRANVTNLLDGKTYAVRGAPCSFPNCLCDAVVEGEVKGAAMTLYALYVNDVPLSTFLTMTEAELMKQELERTLADWMTGAECQIHVVEREPCT